ncbi:MAG: hypothetical protein HY040_04125 [Planctomycetes bacterium]|nr:hypothetical protein [Planctomycetota bacterium]
MNNSLETTAVHDVLSLRDLSIRDLSIHDAGINDAAMNDAEVTELSLLLPTGQFRALACAAEARGLTIGQLVRCFLRDALAGSVSTPRFLSQRRHA